MVRLLRFVPLLAALAAASALGMASGVQAPRETKILPSDPAVGAQFGRSVAMDGDILVVGAWYDDDKGPSSGSAYVYRREGSGWAQEAKLTASDGAAGDRFGFSTAIDADTIVIGSRYDDHAFVDAGSAYVFHYNGSAWVQQAKLTAQDAATQDEFSTRVAISGDVVVAGAPLKDEAGNVDAGAAYVFRRTSGVWARETKLTVPEEQPGDHFGGGASVSGDTILISALHHDLTGVNEGAAWVFERQSGVWTRTAMLTASDGETEDRFGIRTAMQGDVILIGAWLDDDGGSDAGSAYVFRRVEGNWVEEAKLHSLHPATDDHFGVRTAIDGDLIAIGATDDNYQGYNLGSAYVFRRVDGTWQVEAKIGATDGAADDHFGGDVAIVGDILGVGARGDDDAGADSGSAYVYDLTLHPDCSSPTIVGTDAQDAILGTTGPDVIDARGGDDYIAAISGDDIICGGEGNDTVYCGRGLDVFEGGAGTEKVAPDCETALGLR